MSAQRNGACRWQTSAYAFINTAVHDGRAVHAVRAWASAATLIVRATGMDGTCFAKCSISATNFRAGDRLRQFPLSLACGMANIPVRFFGSRMLVGLMLPVK